MPQEVIHRFTASLRFTQDVLVVGWAIECFDDLHDHWGTMTVEVDPPRPASELLHEITAHVRRLAVQGSMF